MCYNDMDRLLAGMCLIMCPLDPCPLQLVKLSLGGGLFPGCGRQRHYVSGACHFGGAIISRGKASLVTNTLHWRKVFERVMLEQLQILLDKTDLSGSILV